MKLQTLRLHGFKSFADRTALDFREGVTAIVGSNGCGKSNIADSIRWVLGERRASAIRGSKMEEAIFQGTARRRPLNFAEVSLVFDNRDGRVPVPQTEIEVSRKVFREGGSEYALNRTACRLRDVQGLLRDTGLGSNAYAVIEASMIETLLSDRAEERRMLFEEAAGIGRYKDSRQAAMRRLDAAQADLTRLDDLIAEVESKVRTLARQKRRAERHRELQARRLDLEVAIARVEVASLEDELRALDARRRELDEFSRIASAERATAEAVIEERRIEAAELGRQRTTRAARLDEVRAAIDAREREVLVARERRDAAELRMQRLSEEKAELVARLDEIGRSAAGEEEARGSLAERVERERALAEAKGEENLEIRRALAAGREAMESAAARARERAREIATAEGERAGAERRRRDALERRAEVVEQLERVRRELAQMTDQTELWETQADEFRDRAAAAAERLEEAREAVAVLRGREQRAREEARLAEDRLSTLASQVAVRDALERSYEGFSPAVAAVMAARDRFPGVHGPLADRLEAATPEQAAGFESYLGPLLQALVVEDLATARAIRGWFREEWRGGGSLLLLPLDIVRQGKKGPSAPPGASDWVEFLLDGLIVVEGDALAEFTPGAARVGSGGDLIDRRGVIRLTEAAGDPGILARRDELARLRARTAESGRERDARLAARDELRDRLAAAEQEADEAEEYRRVVEAQRKALELDAATYRESRSRLLRDRDALEGNLGGLEAAAAEAATRLEALERRLAELAAAVGSAGAEEDAARDRLSTLEARWDEAREQEAELRIVLGRSEADLRDADRRLAAAAEERAAAGQRREAIDREGTEIRASLEDLAGVRESAAAEIETLFGRRDEETGRLALIDARLAEVDSELAELGERARAARRRETEASEERHRVELRLAELGSRSERARERLEVEWGRPWSALLADAAEIEGGDPEAWRRELRQASEQLDGLGPVNMLAVEEHAEEERRLDFLMAQRSDLVEARDNLVAAIRQINKTAREVFQSTFDTVRANFKRTFDSLFEGGECDVWLADPDDPLESAVEIQASPVGKKTQRIHLLSGGERTLTALALLFALYLVKPSPFCVMDEVDAPLDEANVGRFIQLLHDFKRETQFIVITHNPRTMEAADWVYGVTMEEPGISTIVGVELLGAWASDPPAGRTAAG